MSCLITLLFFVAGISQGFCDDEITVSPKHTFEIVQKYREQDQMYGHVWTETLHFFKDNAKDIVLEYGISWPALYYVSPDDQWILRIQKSGSGDNISYLYRVESNQSVWRMEEQVGELGFAFLAHQPGGLPSGLYHTGIEFTSWDLQSGLLHFTIHGSGDHSGDGIERSLTFNLVDHHISAP
ncbi:MAG: hypothetical protein LV480_07960 [Methylacidiphilales bacterium]|nr:hypothetical protein [Candidatus Methylacidiphilales bacterium]